MIATTSQSYNQPYTTITTTRSQRVSGADSFCCRITISQPSSPGQVVTCSQSSSTTPRTRFKNCSSQALPPLRAHPSSPRHSSQASCSSSTTLLPLLMPSSSYWTSCSSFWLFLRYSSSSEKAQEVAMATGLSRMASELALKSTVRVNTFSASDPTPFLRMPCPTLLEMSAFSSSSPTSWSRSYLCLSLQWVFLEKRWLRQGSRTRSRNSSAYSDCTHTMRWYWSISASCLLSRSGHCGYCLRTSSTNLGRREHSE